MLCARARARVKIKSERTINVSQRRYWIQDGKRTVKTAIGKCLLCRRVYNRGLAIPAPGPLPAERLAASPPFSSSVGVDFAGPFTVLASSDTTGRTKVKRWLLLFTCGSTRSVHIEITTSTSAKATILAFQRFWARRGVHTGIVYMDNGSGLVLAAKALQEGTELVDGLKQEAAHLGFTFRLIPVAAPWFGGCYERLVGLLKHHLKPTLHKKNARRRGLSHADLPG